MAASTYDEALRRLLLHEGGYSNHPEDPGGPTNFGITLADYRKYMKPGANAEDVRAMRIEDAKAIYRSKYWMALRCGDLPAGVDYSVFDYGVNSGVGRAGKVLRRVVGLPDDTWTVTDEVLREVARRDTKAVIAAINDERLRFLEGLSTWPVFGSGWSQRVSDLRNFSLHLADVGHPDASPPVIEAVPAKGIIPPPRILKTAISHGAPATAGLTAFSFMDWITAHPLASAAITIVSLCTLTGASYGLNQWRRARQDAPTPGLVPIPPK